MRYMPNFYEKVQQCVTSFLHLNRIFLREIRPAAGGATGAGFTIALALKSMECGESALPYFWLLPLLATVYKSVDYCYSDKTHADSSKSQKPTALNCLNACVGWTFAATSYFGELLLAGVYADHDLNFKHPALQAMAGVAVFSATVDQIPQKPSGYNQLP
jgi:hypothetical protein